MQAALDELTSQSGIQFVAARIDLGTVVTRLNRRPVPVEGAIHRIARRLNTVPVFLSRTHSIEFVPEAELAGRRFSDELIEEELTTKFVGTDPGYALRWIAQVARADMVVPRPMRCTIDGAFEKMNWRRTMQAVLEAAGSGGRLVVAQNGLVEVSP